MFLTNEINAEDFSFCFMAQHDTIVETLRDIENDFEENFDELSKIYYVPSEDGSGFRYRNLTHALIRHYHEGKEFKKYYPDGTEVKSL